MPHDKFKKMSAGQKNAFPLDGNQGSKQSSYPPPGLPATDPRVKLGKDIDREKVELLRDNKLEREMGEISDTESESSAAGVSATANERDWAGVWKEVQK